MKSLNNNVIADTCATRNLIFKGIEIEAQKVHNFFLATLSYVYVEVIN
jgi:hypothetical protein